MMGAVIEIHKARDAAIQRQIKLAAIAKAKQGDLFTGPAPEGKVVIGVRFLGNQEWAIEAEELRPYTPKPEESDEAKRDRRFGSR